MLMEVLYRIILELDYRIILNNRIILDASGLAFCIYCNKPVSYGSSGKKDILARAKKSPDHLWYKKDYCQTTFLPLSWD